MKKYVKISNKFRAFRFEAQADVVANLVYDGAPKFNFASVTQLDESVVQVVNIDGLQAPVKEGDWIVVQDDNVLSQYTNEAFVEAFLEVQE